MPPTAGAGNNPENPIPLEQLQKQFGKQEAEANVQGQGMATQ